VTVPRNFDDFFFGLVDVGDELPQVRTGDEIGFLRGLNDQSRDVRARFDFIEQFGELSERFPRQDVHALLRIINRDHRHVGSGKGERENRLIRHRQWSRKLMRRTVFTRHSEGA
jgi:hypothetical protein